MFATFGAAVRSVSLRACAVLGFAAATLFPTLSAAQIQVYADQGLAYKECLRYQGSFTDIWQNRRQTFTQTCTAFGPYDLGGGQGSANGYRMTITPENGYPGGTKTWWMYKIANTCLARSATSFLTEATQVCNDGCSYTSTGSHTGEGGETLLDFSPNGGVCSGSPPPPPPPVDPNRGKPGCGKESGNPINCATGNKFQSEADLVGFGLLQFVRFYNSTPGVDSHLGPNWSASYSQRIDSLDGSHVAVRRADGAGFRFSQNGSSWLPPLGIHSALNRLTDANGVLTGWTFLPTDGREAENYDALGRLLSIVRNDGSSITIIYNFGIIEGSSKDYLPTSITDQSGRKLTFGYDTSNRLQLLTDPTGTSYSYSYDASGRLSGVAYPGGASKTYLYNEPGQTGGADLPNALTGIVDEKNQRFATFGYQAGGRAVSTEHAGGVSKFVLQYNDVTGTTTIDSPDGGQEQRGFNRTLPKYELASTSESANGQTKVTSRTFDANGSVDVETDAAGITTDFDFNSRGLEIQRIESANQAATRRTIQTDWHSTFSVPTERRLFDGEGNLEAKETWTYNARGQVLTSTLVNLTNAALDRTTTFAYCEQSGVSASTCPIIGLLLSIDGPRTDVVDTTVYTYRQAEDASCGGNPTACAFRKGDLWKITNAKGQVTEVVAYDAAGRPRSIKDTNSVVTDSEYSPRGWTTARKVRGFDNSTEVDDAITRLEYDNTGTVIKVVQPDGTYTSFGYDAAHRLTDVGDALGGSIHYTLNNAGRKVQEDIKNSGGSVVNTLSRVFDALGQLKTVADAQATPIDFTYDVRGNLDSTTDPLLRVTDNDYDALGRLKQEIANTGGGVSDRANSLYDYDVRDNLRSVVDPKGLTTTYSHDSTNNLTQLVSPDTGTTIYTYDAAGNRVGEMKADSKAEGFVYDSLGRITLKTYADGQNVTFTYDATQSDCSAVETFSVGRLTRIDDSSGSTRLCYDARGNNVRRVQNVNGGSSLALTQTYDAAGQLIAMGYPSGAIVVYLRDANGQIERIDSRPTATAAQISIVSAATYLPFGPLHTLLFGNGRMLAKEYDANYGISRVSDSASADAYDVRYTLNSVGNIVGLTEKLDAGTPSKTTTLTYDGLDRLISQKYLSVFTEQYTYNSSGDRTFSKVGFLTAANFTYAADSHRIATVQNNPVMYSATGEMTSYVSKSYQYDDRHRLSIFKKTPSTGASGLIHLAYNGLGQRVSRYQGSQAPTQFVYDNWGRLIGEYTASGVRIKEYVWLDDTVVSVLSDFDGTSYQYVETDHLGSPRSVIHPAKNISIWQWSLTQGSFGDTQPFEDPDGDSLTYNLNLRFPGQYYDPTTFVTQNGFRDYFQAFGRYTESDPIGLDGGMSTYGYAQQNPLRNADPTGLSTLVIVGSPVGSNPFGHVAVAFTGRGVYSYGTGVNGRNGGAPTPLGGSLTDYINAQGSYRDSTAFLIDTTPEQEQAMIEEILSFRGKKLPDPRRDLMGALKDTCATRTQSALEAGGITSRTIPFTSPFPGSTWKIGYFNASQVYDLPQGAAPPGFFSLFNPRPRGP
jgi:RHS repeat-associated protein